MPPTMVPATRRDEWNYVERARLQGAHAQRAAAAIAAALGLSAPTGAVFAPPPDDGTAPGFGAFVYQTQAVQALCIGAQAAFYRAARNMSGARGNMGSLYWQLIHQIIMKKISKTKKVDTSLS